MVEEPRPKIFIGSTSEIKNKQYPEYLRNALLSWADVEIWGPSFFKLSRTPIESLEENLPNYDCCLFFFTDDDITIIRNKRKVTPRDNIIFEAGMSIGLHTRINTFLIVPSNREVEFPSDFHGMTVAYYDPESQDFTKISEQIKQSIVPRPKYNLSLLSGSKQAGIVDIYPDSNSFRESIKPEFVRMQKASLGFALMGVTLNEYFQGKLYQSMKGYLDALKAKSDSKDYIRALISHPDSMALRECANMEEAPLPNGDYCLEPNLQYYRKSRVFRDQTAATKAAQELCELYKGNIEIRHYTQTPMCSLFLSDQYAYVESHTSVLKGAIRPS